MTAENIAHDVSCWCPSQVAKAACLPVAQRREIVAIESVCSNPNRNKMSLLNYYLDLVCIQSNINVVTVRITVSCVCLVRVCDEELDVSARSESSGGVLHMGRQVPATDRKSELRALGSTLDLWEIMTSPSRTRPCRQRRGEADRTHELQL